ncbi:MAG: leucine-rich repeat protein [Lachnospiraceae bacterium]|nr:leucine-rich repeat protein [Lachnospiraceae bacterium]
MEIQTEEQGKIADYAYAQNRELTEAVIPAETRCIGRHAFYNCRALETISLPHGKIEIEDGAFKNCHRVSRIILWEGAGDCSCLRDILYDMNQEITVTVHYGRDEKAVLLFPHYEYEFIANEPARIFSEVGYGAGYLYQQCFYNAQIDYPRYDGLWKQACVSEDIPVLGKLLSYRLQFPYGLSAEARADYLAYWEEHMGELLEFYMKESDMDSLKFFLEKNEWPDKANLPVTPRHLAREIAEHLKRPELISYVLDLERRLGSKPAGAGKFQL